MSVEKIKKTNFWTLSGERWCVRLLSVIYYFAIGPLLYDLYLNGVRWRAGYLFVFMVLAVSGLQAGYKGHDRWTQRWYRLNLLWLVALNLAFFFYAPFAKIVGAADWEKWATLGFLGVSILLGLLGFILPKRPMPSPNEGDEDLEKGLPPMPNQNPAN